MVSNAGGNPWGYRYNVFGHSDRRLYRTQEGERGAIARISELAREANDSPHHLSRSIVSEIDRVSGEYTHVEAAIESAIIQQMKTDEKGEAEAKPYFVHGLRHTWYATRKGERYPDAF